MCRLSCPVPVKVDKLVKDAGDTARLHKKIEKKLNALVIDVTPPDLIDCMQGNYLLVDHTRSEIYRTTD